jgi:hypothetical protein
MAGSTIASADMVHSPGHISVPSRRWWCLKGRRRPQHQEPHDPHGSGQAKGQTCPEESARAHAHGVSGWQGDIRHDFISKMLEKGMHTVGWQRRERPVSLPRNALVARAPIDTDPAIARYNAITSSQAQAGKHWLLYAAKGERNTDRNVLKRGSSHILNRTIRTPKGNIDLPVSKGISYGDRRRAF